MSPFPGPGLSPFPGFDDDDLGVRVRQAGFRLLVALNVFVHHFGSRTFAGLGIDCQEQLRTNFERFKDKWGPERAAGYRLETDKQTGRQGDKETGGAGQPAGSMVRERPMVATAPATVSLCVIVRDEEANLPACLESVRDLVDDCVVVDTGSTDRTKEIAAGFGARVFDFPWVDSFAAARNECLRHATGEWILWLDADDRLDDGNRRKLRELFAGLNGDNVAYVMKCLCLPDPVNGTATVVDHVRLFRNDSCIRWKYRVHEQMLPAVREQGGAVRWSDVVIRHVGYQDPALRRRKLDRDLRLLQLEDADHPDDPFTLFNLGSVALELGRPADALPLLQRSLQLSQPGDSIVRKLYALCVQCHRQLAEDSDALAACRAGRSHYPDDAELLFQEGLVLRERGDPAGAEAAWQRLLGSREGDHFASVDSGLRGYKARHNLAVLYQEQGRPAEAEAQWHAALAECPGFHPAWVGLGELYLARECWAELDGVLAHLESGPVMATETALLRARAHLVRREFGEARRLLEASVARAPGELWPRVLLSHALLQGGQDWPAAERALRQVLALDPAHAEARQNLAVLLRQQGRAAELDGLDRELLTNLFRAACATPSDISEHCPTLAALAGECRHVTEMGTRTGVSTTAFLYAGPDRLVCYDKVRFPQVDRLAALAGRTQFVFRQADVLQVEMEETDLLFIDTWHVYEQLREELSRHAGKVRRYLVLHDTTTFGEQGEAEGHRGLWPAVQEFLVAGAFRLKQRYENNNGLTVLERAAGA